MDCVTCTPTTQRPDRPHTFLMHEMGACEKCSTKIEARVIERDNQVFHLVFCESCGTTEKKIHDDAELYMKEFLAHGAAGKDVSGDHQLKTTTSTCPSCLELLPANVVIRDNRVYFQKDCAQCGPSEALVSENADYYVNAYSYARAGTEPFHFPNTVEHGCPSDCGTCNDHEQHTCLPIVEITDHCNLECPICIVNNQYANHMSVESFSRIVDRLVESEGMCESIALSGGEPTSHPKILDMIDAATRDEIGRVVVITNGIRLGKDWKFAEEIKKRGAYVSLQFDGFSAETHEKIRGRDLCAEKKAALDALKEFNIPTQLIFVAARGANEHQIGQMVDLFLSEPHFLSLNFQPAAFSGFGGGQYPHDPMDRLTIPGVIRAIEDQTNGMLVTDDFTPLPCSHPQCVSLSYLLRLNDGSHIPFSRFVDFRKHGALLNSSATLGASPQIHDVLHEVIYDVFARQDEIERGPEILAALRRVVDNMFPETEVTPKEAISIGEGEAKSIFLHHYMDRHDFDLERLRKCCHHYPQEDGRVMPACGFNMFHRGAAQGPDTPTPEWGKGPFANALQPPKQGSLTLPIVK